MRLGETEAKRGNGVNPYAVMIEECYGLDKIEFLESHKNREIYQKAFNIIERYFGTEEEDKSLATAMDQASQSFSLEEILQLHEATSNFDDGLYGH